MHARFAWLADCFWLAWVCLGWLYVGVGRFWIGLLVAVVTVVVVKGPASLLRPRCSGLCLPGLVVTVLGVLVEGTGGALTTHFTRPRQFGPCCCWNHLHDQHANVGFINARVPPFIGSRVRSQAPI